MTSLPAPLLPIKAESDDFGDTMSASLSHFSTSFTKRTLRAAAAAVVFLLLLFLFSSTSYAPTSISSYRSSRGGDKLYNAILNQTLGFEKLYSIIMPSRTDLKDSLQLAAGLTGLQIDVIDGQHAPKDPKAFPPHPEGFGTQNAAIGAWRAHMNVMRMIVQQNISSAVVMESDVDWDYRIHEQMQGFARASRLLNQPGAENSWFEDGDPMRNPLPTTSPYGDDWDLLWLGHCGVNLPSDGGHIPIGRAAYHDPTVPPIAKMRLRGTFKNELREAYGEHTRIVSHTDDPLCSIAYAVSQRGARKFLYEMGTRQLDAAADLMFAWACDGTHGRPLHKCLTVNPQLFNQHRAAGPMNKASNIQDYKGEIRHSSSENIMFSTKTNFAQLVHGRPEEEFIEWGHGWSQEDAEWRAEQERKAREKAAAEAKVKAEKEKTQLQKAAEAKAEAEGFDAEADDGR